MIKSTIILLVLATVFSWAHADYVTTFIKTPQDMTSFPVNTAVVLTIGFAGSTTTPQNPTYTLRFSTNPPFPTVPNPVGQNTDCSVVGTSTSQVNITCPSANYSSSVFEFTITFTTAGTYVLTATAQGPGSLFASNSTSITITGAATTTTTTGTTTAGTTTGATTTGATTTGATTTGTTTAGTTTGATTAGTTTTTGATTTGATTAGTTTTTGTVTGTTTTNSTTASTRTTTTTTTTTTSTSTSTSTTSDGVATATVSVVCAASLAALAYLL